MAIVEGSCKIEIPANVGFNIMGIGAEPPIPSDEELSEVFPDWYAKGKVFIGRCLQEEGKSGFDPLLPQDFFKYGMKFVITEAKKIAGG
jgi:hypothetical protein